MIVRIYTGQDGQTHFEDLPQPAEESHNVALQAGANLMFRRFAADYSSDWHTAPRRQYIFILVGQMEIGIGDGTCCADQCHCAGGRLTRVLPPSTVFHEASWREPGGAGWLPGAMTRPATPGRFGCTRGDCVCQSANV